MAGIHYTIKQNRLNEALLVGMEHGECNSICSVNQEGSNYFVLPVLNSGVEDCPWGRLRFELELPENSMCYLYVAASNEYYGQEVLMSEESTLLQKKKILQVLRGLCFSNKSDVLLYEITGRYLWIMVEAVGKGIKVKNIRVEAPGDNFMQTFPEIYREKNSFFHRYLSIYSSIYNDFQEKLDMRSELLPVEEAPLSLLELYAKWLGIDVDGGYLGEDTLRKLLLEAPALIKMKGTQYCMERICSIVLGEKPIIAERGLMQRYVQRSEKAQYDSLYGNSPYDVSLLLKRCVDEKKKGQLLHLLGQFKPIRCRLQVVFLEPTGILDEHSYLDENAVIFSQEKGVLDTAQLADGTIIIQ